MQSGALGAAERGGEGACFRRASRRLRESSIVLGLKFRMNHNNGFSSPSVPTLTRSYVDAASHQYFPQVEFHSSRNSRRNSWAAYAKDSFPKSIFSLKSTLRQPLSTHGITHVHEENEFVATTKRF